MVVVIDKKLSRDIYNHDKATFFFSNYLPYISSTIIVYNNQIPALGTIHVDKLR